MTDHGINYDIQKGLTIDPSALMQRLGPEERIQFVKDMLKQTIHERDIDNLIFSAMVHRLTGMDDWYNGWEMERRMEFLHAVCRELLGEFPWRTMSAMYAAARTAIEGKYVLNELSRVLELSDDEADRQLFKRICRIVGLSSHRDKPVFEDKMYEEIKEDITSTIKASLLPYIDALGGDTARQAKDWGNPDFDLEAAVRAKLEAGVSK